MLAEQDQALSPGRASFAAPCKGKHSPGRVLSPQAPSTQLRAGVGQGADPPSTPPCCGHLAGVGCRGSGGSCASKQSHGVDEIPLRDNTWKPRRKEGNSPQLTALLQAAACDVAASGCRQRPGVTGSWCHKELVSQGAGVTGRATHAGAKPPRGRAPNSAICFPFQSDRAETDFIELLSNS